MTDLVQAERERRDDAEVSAAAPDRPEQVRILVRAGPDLASLSASTMSAPSRLSIARPHLRVRCPNPPPSVRPPTPVVEMMPLGVAESVGVGCLVDLAPCTAPTDRHGSLLRGRPGCPWSRDRSITRPSSQLPRPAPCALRRGRRAEGRAVAGEGDGHTPRRRGPTDPGYECRVLVDECVVDLAGFLVSGIGPADQLARGTPRAPGWPPALAW